MRPMIDDLELPQVQEIVTSDRRSLAELKPPGMEGSLLQDLGRQSTEVVVRGVASGPEAAAFARQIDVKFREGAPVPFTADIVADSAIENVVIDDLVLEDAAGKPGRFPYAVTLREHQEPVAPADTSLLDTSILDEAQDLMGDLIDGLDIGVDLADGLQPFVSTIGDLLERLRAFGSAIEQAGG